MERLDVRSPIIFSLSAALLTAGCTPKAEPHPGSSTSAPSSLPPAPTGSAILRGVVKLAGDAGEPDPWYGAGDAECKSLHRETIRLIKARDGKLEDVFVYIKAGLPEGSYPTPNEPVALD